MKNNFLKNTTYTLDLKKYKNQIVLADSEILYFSRLEKRSNHKNKIDSFGSHWILAYAPSNSKDSFISIRDGSKFVPIHAGDCLFAPAYSILEWKMESSQSFQWQAFISALPLPTDFPTKPLLFKQSHILYPKNRKEIINYIYSLIDQNNYLAIEQQKVKSIFAARAKEAIELNYNKEKSIKELTQSLKASRMTFSNLFKKSYGLTPVEYRHRLRIFEALRLINIGKSITDASYDSGFKDHAQFLYHFKRLLHTTPLNYSPRKLVPTNIESEIKKGAFSSSPF